MSDGTREQLFLVTWSLDGNDMGTWDQWTGGGKDTASVRYRSGGQPDEESLGGPNTYPDVTIERNYRLSRDYPIMPTLLARAGKGTVIGQKQALDRDYNAYGKPEIIVGLLKTVTSPPADSTSSNPAKLIVVVEVNSYTASA